MQPTARKKIFFRRKNTKNLSKNPTNITSLNALTKGQNASSFHPRRGEEVLGGKETCAKLKQQNCCGGIKRRKVASFSVSFKYVVAQVTIRVFIVGIYPIFVGAKSDKSSLFVCCRCRKGAFIKPRGQIKRAKIN